MCPERGLPAVIECIAVDESGEPLPPSSSVPMDTIQVGSTWRGSYTCQGQHPMTLEILKAEAMDTDSNSALAMVVRVHFTHSDGEGSYLAQGELYLKDRLFSLEPLRWLDRPERFIPVSLEGVVARNKVDIAGLFLGPSAPDNWDPELTMSCLYTGIIPECNNGPFRLTLGEYERDSTFVWRCFPGNVGYFCRFLTVRAHGVCR